VNNVVTLSECCAFIKDGTHGSPVRTPGGIPVLSAAHVRDGRLHFDTDRFTSEEEFLTFQKRLKPVPGDVLLTIVGTIGRTAIIDRDKPFVFQRSVCVLRPKKNVVISTYLKSALESDAVKSQFHVEKHEVAQAGIYLEALNEIKIPLPSLPEQARVTTPIDKADRLRRTRRYALELTDSFLPAAFLELFGDPVTNQKGWKVSPFGEVAPSRLGKMLDANQQTGRHGRPYLRNENVQWDRFDLTEVSVMDFDADDREAFLLSPGDLLICEGGEPGRCAIWRGELPESYFQKALHRARPVLSKAIPEYLVHLLWSLSRKGGLNDYVTSATIAHLTGEKLKLMPIPVPPLPLQQKFAGLVERVERLRAVQREALRQAEHLFASLLHRAFSG